MGKGRKGRRRQAAAWRGRLRSGAWWALGGAAMGASFAVQELEWLLPLSVLPWLEALERQPVRRAFLRGWLGGFAFVFVGLSWLHHVASFIVVAAALYFGAYLGVFAVLAARMRHGLGLPLWVAAPLAAWAHETLLLHVTFFPVNWLFLGGVTWRVPWLVQGVELGGVSLLTFVVVLVGATLHHALRSGTTRGWRAAATWRPLGIAAAAVAAMLLFGAVRTATLDLSDGPRVALVQGDVPQAVRLDPRRSGEVLDKHVRMTLGVRGEDVDLVVWPESTTPKAPEVDPSVRRALSACARGVRAHLLVGGVGINPGTAPSNSAFLFDPSGTLVGRSDKRVLVPFAETLLVIDRIPPLRDALSDYLSRTMKFRPFLIPGRRAVTWSVSGFAVGAMICYGDTVPGPAADLRAAGADLLVTLSNEAWFPPGELDQHLQLAVLRSVETRLPMARATNTGDTCVIDPLGRVVRRLPRDEGGVLVATIPVASARAVPEWMRRALSWLVTGAAVALALEGWRRKRGEA